MVRDAAVWDELDEDWLGYPVLSAFGAGSPPGGVSFLVSALGDPDARIIVRLAFGADPKGNPALWNFYDVTTDVRLADGQRIDVSPMGRSDETSQAQPAGCGLQLNNTTGDYTPDHPGSRWWPYVRENTPLKVELYIYGDLSLEFQGYVNGFLPAWDTSGKVAIVTVSASGILRRLQQGKTPLYSPLRRAHTSKPVPPVLYCPCEDGSAAVTAASGLPGGLAVIPVTKYGAVRFAGAPAAQQPAGSDVQPDLSAGGALHAVIPLGSRAPTAWTVEFTFAATATTGTAGLVRILTVDTTGAKSWYELAINLSGTPQILDGGNLESAALSYQYALWFFGTSYSAVGLNNGTPRHVRITAVERATSVIDYRVYVDDVLVMSDLGSAGVAHVGAVTDVFVNAYLIDGWSSSLASGGHVGVYDYELTPAMAGGNHGAAAKGYAGETATARLVRLCGELGIPIDIIGTSDTTMGPQGIGTHLSLFRECEATDDGLLGDGRGPGLFYVTRQYRYNRPASLSPDMAADPPQVDDPFEPKHDDQRRRNIIKVDRKGGSSAIYEDVDSPVGTGEVHDYDASVPVNYADDSGLYNRAAHEVRKGTVPGLRYPRLNLDLAGIPALVRAWRATPIGGRIDVLNVTSKATQHPPGTVALLLEGYTAQLGKFTWKVFGNCSSFRPWRVAVLEATDPEYAWRLDAGACTLRQDYPAGATSILVDITDGQFWSTLAGDWPRDLDVGGVRVTATAAVAELDAFGRTSASGWGNADVGGFWDLIGAGGTVNTTDWTVGSGVGTESVPAANAYRMAYLGATSWLDVDAAVTWTAPLTTGGPLEPGNLLLRGTTTTSYVLVRAQVETSNAVTIVILAASGATLGSCTVPGLTHAGVGTPLRLRARAVGSQVSAKVWNPASIEPSWWHITVTDPAAPVAGFVGVRSGVSASNTNTLPVAMTADDFTATGTPQQLTISPAPYPLRVGDAVRLWRQPTLAL